MRSAMFSFFLAAAAGLALVAAQDGELKIEVTLAVECDRTTKIGDKITVDYRGTFTNGTEFDSSYGGEPFTFDLGAGEVIEGFDKGLLDMCIGEKRTLTIPPNLGYGDEPVGPIPAGSTLIFYTELKGIEGVPTPTSIITKPISSPTPGLGRR
ncbi:hypothetical protein VTK73DRAFT_9253 [Phialemonium thermophilum]|uniref:peptidylprolyl isomerase n=1 Tax=Phialemonium thermophilum TaxID=223376 RepID=A0ABR3XLW4_9PEZI